MTRKTKVAQKHEFYKLLKMGYSQKDAANKVNITEKTAGVWAKDWIETNELFKQSIKNIAQRLKDLTADKRAIAQDIKTLTGALRELEESQFVSINPNNR